ncbi:MAG: DUF1254 domain-containing protein [Pseudomonadota bacterium]
MSPVRVALVAFVISTLLSSGLISLFAPKIMMGFALTRVERGDAATTRHVNAVGRNTMYPSQPVDERYGPDSFYIFTRPNPDILYSGCSFDLTAGPIEVGLQNIPEYASIAVHADNTDNFGVVNNRDFSGEILRALIVAEGATAPSDFDGPVFESPTRRGLVIVRILLERREAFDHYRRLQQEQYCRPFRRSGGT